MPKDKPDPEWENYYRRRQKHFTAFITASNKLAGHIVEMIPDLEQTRRRIALLNYELREKDDRSHKRVAVAQINRFFEGMRDSSHAKVEEMKVPMEVKGGSLIMQLYTIKTAAMQYTITNDDEEKFDLEHTLVRAGANFKDDILDRLGTYDVKFLTARNYKSLKKFCRLYEEVLITYNAFCTLEKPEYKRDKDDGLIS